MTVQTYALTRAVSSSINNCELTHITREPINVSLARQQHHQYEQALSTSGCRIISIGEESDLPDAVFIEDTAVVLDEIAVITRSGAISRRAETPSVAAALNQFRQLAIIEAPGALEGGDVLRLGKYIFVGESKRSNREGVAQLRSITSPYGYIVHSVPLKGCLHLKSAVTQLGRDFILINPAWVDPAEFDRFQIIEVDMREPYAANALSVRESVIYPTAYPRTTARLEKLGINIIPVDVSELIKAEGAVTCCSLIFDKEL